MNILSIICEYNPLHNGHAYHLATQKEKHGADGVICLMSGSFTQRGLPAIYDKWSRAEAAVKCGADLVLELPVVYSAQSAMRFSFGAVSLLQALGCVNLLSFGSESGDIEKLKKAAGVISSETFSAYMKSETQKGISYPAARSNILEKGFPTLPAEIISSPNNILAIEYIRAIKALESEIIPVTHDRKMDFKSASYIRDKIYNKENISEHIPEVALSSFGTPCDLSAFDYMVTYHFRKQSAESLREIADVAEGLEYRFIKAAKECFGANELAESVKTKRYTRTRIDRIITNTLLGITDEDTALPPQYARVLAFNDCGKQILKTAGETSQIPFITKMADVKPTTPEFQRMLDIDLLSTDIYALLTSEKRAGQDFTHSPIYVK